MSNSTLCKVNFYRIYLIVSRKTFACKSILFFIYQPTKIYQKPIMSYGFSLIWGCAMRQWNIVTMYEKSTDQIIKKEPWTSFHHSQ